MPRRRPSRRSRTRRWGPDTAAPGEQPTGLRLRLRLRLRPLRSRRRPAVAAMTCSASSTRPPRRREQALLSDALRSDPPSAAELLHPSFTEIGASGRSDDREEILAHLAPLGGIDAEEFVADEVAPGVVLLQYTTHGPGGAVHRSSLWVREKGRWLLRHHQGTPARAADGRTAH